MQIAGLGATVPSRLDLSWAQRRNLLDQDRLNWGYTSVAIADRTAAPELGTASSRIALDRSNLSAEDIGLLIYCPTWHQGPEGWLPHSYLQRELSLTSSKGFEVRQGCNGLLAGLHLAQAAIDSGMAKHAMLVAADNYGTQHFDRWRMGHGFLAGDAGVALTVTSESGFATVAGMATETVAQAEGLNRGTRPLFPPDITEGVGIDFAQRQSEFLTSTTPELRAELQVLMTQIQHRTRAAATRACRMAGISTSDIDHFVYMNYAVPIVEQFCQAVVGLELDRARTATGSRLGHCGAADHFLTVDALALEGRLHTGQHVLLLGVGPGVSIDAVVLRVDAQPEWEAATEEKELVCLASG